MVGDDHLPNQRGQFELLESLAGGLAHPAHLLAHHGVGVTAKVHAATLRSTSIVAASRASKAGWRKLLL
jgi:hypothetical protein